MKNHAKIFVLCFFVAVKLNAMHSSGFIFTYDDILKVGLFNLASKFYANKTSLDQLKAALLAAARENKADYIHGICNMKVIDIDEISESGDALLHRAAFYGSTRAADAILSHGATIDILDNKKLTPLFLAVLLGHIGTVELLLERGAKIGIVEVPGCGKMSILDGIMLIEDKEAVVLRQKQSEIAVALINYGATTQNQETLECLASIGVQYPLETEEKGVEQ